MTTTIRNSTKNKRFLVLLLFVLAACSASRAPVQRAAPRPAPLHEGPLTDFVPAAGLRWMIVGRPSELAADPKLREPLSLLFPDARLAAFEAATGVDLRRTPSALVAQFDYSTLYAAETGSDNSLVEDRFVARLLNDPLRQSSHPRVSRVTGIVGTTPQALVRVADDLVAVAVGDPTPARVVEMFALRKLERTVPALQGSALSTLPDDLEADALRYYAPGPFTGAWQRGARGLLSGALAVGAAGRCQDGKLTAVVVLSGEWKAAEDIARMLGAWEDLTASSLGRLLALNAPLEGPHVDLNGALLRLRVTLDVRPLLSGLHAAVAADVWQLMNFPRAPESPRGARM